MWYVTEERELMRKIAQEFADKELKSYVPEMEQNKPFPKQLSKRMAELGFNGLAFSTELGGLGTDWVAVGMVLEELARVSPNASFLYGLSAYAFPVTIATLGTPQQIEQWVKPSITGNIDWAFSSTEPAGFACWPEYQTRAVLDGDEWVINGSKIFATNLTNADNIIVGCITSTPNIEIAEGYSGIVVPANTPGLEVGHIENKLGLRGSSSGTLYFRNCRVPKENLLGPQDKLWTNMGITTMIEFAAYGAMCLGGAVAVYEKTLKYTKERLQYDKSLFDSFQSVRMSLSKMWMDIEMYRGGLYQTLEMLNQGKDAFKQTCACKVKGAELFESVSSECIVLHGGNGVIVENDIERYFRDAKMFALIGGALPSVTDMLSAFI